MESLLATTRVGVPSPGKVTNIVDSGILGNVKVAIGSPSCGVSALRSTLYRNTLASHPALATSRVAPSDRKVHSLTRYLLWSFRSSMTVLRDVLNRVSLPDIEAINMCWVSIGIISKVGESWKLEYVWASSNSGVHGSMRCRWRSAVVAAMYSRLAVADGSRMSNTAILSIFDLFGRDPTTFGSVGALTAHP